MKKSTRIICSGTLAAAVSVALAAFASGHVGGGSMLSTAMLSTAAPDATKPATGAPARGVGHGAPSLSNKMMSLSTPPPQASFDRFIVKYRDGAATRSTAAILSAVNAAASHAGVAGMKTTTNGSRAALTAQHLRTLAVGGEVIKLSHALARTEADALLAQLRADPAVEYAQPDYIKHRFDVPPDDPNFNLQWHYTHATAGIHAPAAWDTTAGEGVVVAVLDTGYVDHSDLNDNIVDGYDFISAYGQDPQNPDIAGDGDGRDADAHDAGDWTDESMMAWCGRITDSSFHGTHVAGTVAAVTNNGIGLAGVAYNAKVQPVRVLGHCGGFTSDIADAIVWASGGTVDGVPDNTTPAEVLNLSLGGTGSCSSDPVTQAAVDGAIGRGTTVVVAAGNDNDNAANYSPASCEGVITVGATGIDGAKSYFSNYGPAVSVSAPGGSATSGSDPDDAWIWSLGNKGTTTPITGPDGEALVGMIGTSMASPHVAAVVALMQSAAVAAGNPVLTPGKVRTLLRNTAQPFVVAPPMSTPIGAGILDAAAAVAAATQPIGDELATVLVNLQPLKAQTGVAGEGLLYEISVPAGTRSLNLRSYGGNGDVSLYVSFDSIPTAELYDRKSAKPGNSEAVVITNPDAGTYYVRMVGEKAFANVTVLGLYR